MSLSKPLMNLLSSYFQNLYLNPIRTKSITSCIIAAIGNYSSQLVAGEKRINTDSILAFGLFGLLFGGSLPHFFYQFLENVFPSEGVRYGIIRQLLIERLMYTPLFQIFSLYTVSRLEGKDHRRSLGIMLNLIHPVLQANWKWLTIFQIINLSVVPPMLRVLFVNVVGFFWVMFLAKLRRAEAAKAERRNKKE